MADLFSGLESTIGRIFVQPERLHWLWLVALCLVVMGFGDVVQMRWRRRLFTFHNNPRSAAAAPFWARLCQKTQETLTLALSRKRARGHREPLRGRFARFLTELRLRRWLRAGSQIMALVLIVFALADPRAGLGAIQVKPVNLQIVVLLDRSRSMAARDASPNRFEVGRDHVRMLVEEAGGAAVALVSFASEPHIDMPLTRDYQGLLDRLDRIAVSDGPAAGTGLQAGLERAATCFAERMESPKAFVIITDGETHGIEPDPSAAPLPRGTEVLVVGVGDPDQGAPIPLSSPNLPSPSRTEAGTAEPFLTHEGQIVRSQANPRLLGQLAERLGGDFVPHATASAALTDLLQRIDLGSNETAERAYRRQAAPRFHWLLLGACGLLSLEMMLAGASISAAHSSPSRAMQRAISWLLLFGAAISIGPPSLRAEGEPVAPSEPSPLRPLSVRELSKLYNHGVDAYRDGRWQEAEAFFDRVRRLGDGELRSKARFNLANSQYAIANRGGISQQEATARLQRAIELYRQSLAEGQRSTDARANIEIVYRRLLQIQQQSPDSQNSNGSSPPGDAAADEPDRTPPDPNASPNNSREPDSGESNSGEPGSGGPGSGEPDSGESDSEKPMSDEEAESQLGQIRQRARDRADEDARADEGERQASADAAPIPGGLPW